MQLLIVSDTHGSIQLVNEYLSKDNNIDTIDGIIHLGDYYHDGAKLKEVWKKPVYQVIGNCDSNLVGEEEQVININGIKALLCHGHQYNVKWGLTNLYYRAVECNVQVVFFGHSHQRVDLIEDGVRLINPGSASKARDGKGENIGLFCVNDQGEIKYSVIY